jgi:uncharacterized protein YjeT (DUF2065 family)
MKKDINPWIPAFAGMTKSRRALIFLISYEFFLSILASSLVIIVPLIFVYKFKFWDVLNLMPSKVFIVLIFLNRFFGLVYEIFMPASPPFNSPLSKGGNEGGSSFTKGGQRGITVKESNKGGLIKNIGHVLLSAGILVVIAGFILNYAYRFEGIVDLGEGESLIDYDSIEKGPLSKPTKFAIAVEKIEGDPLKSDKSKKVKVRPSSLLSPLSITKVEPAPRFLITDKNGRELHSAFVKLNLNPPGREDYFRSPAVAHRFYLSLTGKPDKPFNIKIVRGKLIVENKEIAIGEEVEFEGLKISFPEISKRAEIKVSHYPGNKVIIIGIGVIGVGIVFQWIKRSVPNKICKA